MICTSEVVNPCVKLVFMLRLRRHLCVLATRLFRSRRDLLLENRDLLLENLALHQQLAVLKKNQRVPRLAPQDKLFWVAIGSSGQDGNGL
jgi:hypothetical protein